MITVAFAPSFSAWRDRARDLLARDVAPENVAWQPEGQVQPTLALFTTPLPPPSVAVPAVPRRYLDLARLALCVDDPLRWTVLYRVLWRLTHGAPHLLDLAVDDDVRRVVDWEHRVRRDIHKMHAFVRFARVEREGKEEFVAWHRPDHWIVEEAAPFFARRFGAMRWSILGPRGCVWWDREALRFGPPAERDQAPAPDALEGLWCAYYAATFNPARVKLRRMEAELPRRHWPTLPETRLIAGLLDEAPARQARMAEQASQDIDAWAGGATTLPALRAAAANCRACTLCDIGTRTVFGEGPAHARIVLVGEQPGDEEDQVGRPFVGPAGQVLDRALAAAGIDRHALYVTNAVKHFHHERVGKARLHKRPTGQHVEVCRGWLARELRAIAPDVVVSLGATAAQALLGRSVAVARARGSVLTAPLATRLVVTWHPSAVLRAGTAGDALFHGLVEDLRRARELAGPVAAAST